MAIQQLLAAFAFGWAAGRLHWRAEAGLRWLELEDSQYRLCRRTWTWVWTWGGELWIWRPCVEGAGCWLSEKGLRWQGAEPALPDGPPGMRASWREETLAYLDRQQPILLTWRRREATVALRRRLLDEVLEDVLEFL